MSGPSSKLGKKGAGYAPPDATRRHHTDDISKHAAPAANQPRSPAPNPTQPATRMFGFFSSRLGCLGSLLVSVVGTVILLVVMRGCSY